MNLLEIQPQLNESKRQINTQNKKMWSDNLCPKWKCTPPPRPEKRRSYEVWLSLGRGDCSFAEGGIGAENTALVRCPTYSWRGSLSKDLAERFVDNDVQTQRDGETAGRNNPNYVQPHHQPRGQQYHTSIVFLLFFRIFLVQIFIILHFFQHGFCKKTCRIMKI